MRGRRQQWAEPARGTGTLLRMSRLRDSLSSVALFVVSAMLIAGCAAPSGPEFLTVSAADYHETFDAAVETARSHDFIASLRDRRHGVIETEPTYAGSIFEPWDPATLTIGRALENTVSFQRRRVRFEFLPIGFVREGIDDRGDDMSLTLTSPDLTTYEGDLELRVWVYVERLHDPTVRRSTWSRRYSSYTAIYDLETGDRVFRTWTPTVRDPALERRLLARIERRLNQ